MGPAADRPGIRSSVVPGETTGSATGARRRRLGVMGGTFDPIHHGHLVAASEVQSWFDLDEVVFVPTGQPWQKDDRAVSAAEHRYLMTVVATASNPRFTTSRVDIERGGATYTIDTLRDLAAQQPDADLYFITGADALAQLLTWREHDHLFDLAHFVGCTRPGYDMDRSVLEGIPADKVTILEIPALAISSTDCRNRRAKGEPVWYLVPDGVVQYISKHDLYARSGGPASPGGRAASAGERVETRIQTPAGR